MLELVRDKCRDAKEFAIFSARIHKTHGVFDYICPMSCGMRDGEGVDAQMQAIKKAGYKLYWIGCGTDDFAWPGTEVMVEILKKNDMEHTLFASDGGHVWYNWRYYLSTFAQLLFK